MGEKANHKHFLSHFTSEINYHWYQNNNTNILITKLLIRSSNWKDALIGIKTLTDLPEYAYNYIFKNKNLQTTCSNLYTWKILKKSNYKNKDEEREYHLRSQP